MRKSSESASDRPLFRLEREDRGALFLYTLVVLAIGHRKAFGRKGDDERFCKAMIPLMGFTRDHIYLLQYIPRFV